MRRPAACVMVAMLVSAAAGACSRSADTMQVLAASSLTEAFEVVADRFERAHPDTDVELSFAASSELAAQIEQGVPADVFAAADEVTMQRLVDRGDVAGEPAAFARNRLAIAVEAGNPEAISSLADLAELGLVVVLCAEQVPCGRFADEALERAGVQLTPATRAENVKAALSLVQLGEADAAIVYATDVEGNPQVEGIAIAEDENVVATYPIARLAAAGNEDDARIFVDFVTSPRGQHVLESFGFLAP
ncbi:MAG: molybdate ABC transporter substrate-binding protein [Acidimicrobiia bacterium]